MRSAKGELLFTFMNLADDFIQSDLQLIQAKKYYFFCQYVRSLGIEPTTFCAANTMIYHWAIGTEITLDVAIHLDMNVFIQDWISGQLLVQFICCCFSKWRRTFSWHIFKYAYVRLSYILVRNVITPVSY